MDKYIFLAMIFLAGCTYIQQPGMTEWDYKAMNDGRTLHCSEMIRETCLTYQWVNGATNTYQRYHYGPGINGANSTDN